MKNKLKNNQGITLVALAVTVVVLLILTGVTINAILGNNGIIRQAKNAANKMNEDMQNTIIAIEMLEQEISKNIKGYNLELPIKDQVIENMAYYSICQDNISMLQTIEVGLNEEKPILERIIELLENCSTEYSSEDRQAILDEITLLIEEIDRIATSTMMNGNTLLNKNKIIKVYYGTEQYREIQLEDFSANSLNLSIDISSDTNIQTSMLNAKNALIKIENKISALETDMTFFENKSTELSRKVETLNSYSYLDNIELEPIQQNGELESDKIAKIDTILTNIETGIETIQTGDENMFEIANILQRMNELAINGINGTNNDNNELNTLRDEINEIANNTNYENIKLLDGTYSQDIVIGLEGEYITITIDSCNTEFLGEDNTEMYIDVSNIENSEKSEKSILAAMEKISDMRSKLGAIQNRLENTSNYYLNLKDVLNSKIENEEIKNFRIALVGLEEIQNCLSRAREVMLQSQNNTFSEETRIHCFYEIDMMLQESDRIANYTKNKEINLLNGEYDEKINVTNQALKINNVTYDTIDNTWENIKKVEEAITKVFALRKNLATK